MSIVLPYYGGSEVTPYREAKGGFNRKSYKLISAPTNEPVSLEEAKAFCRVDGDSEDAVITALIASARRQAEEYTKRAFITQTWELVMDAFSDLETPQEVPGVAVGCAPGLTEGERSISLSRLPIQEITSIKSTDASNVETTVVSSTYTLDESAGRILLNENEAWPTSLREYGGVKVTFVAGYGDNPDDVPELIRQAILNHVDAMHEDRGCGDMPAGVKTMLDPFRTAETWGAW